jgi:small-conductance mechanosensitive channel
MSFSSRSSRIRYVLAMVILAAIAAGAHAGPVMAQHKGADDASLLLLEKPPSVAPVVIDGRTLFYVRGVTAYPATERARAIAERIEAVADAPSTTSLLRLNESDYSTDIFAGDRLLMSIFNADVQIEGMGMGRPVLAKLYLNRIKTAIDAYRAERTPDRLLHESLIAAGCILALAIALTGLFGASRWMSRHIQRKYELAIENIETKAYRLVSAASIWRAIHALFIALCVTVAAAVLIICLHFLLDLFPWTRAYAENFRHLALVPLFFLMREAAAVVPNLLLIALFVLGARYVLRLARRALTSIKQGRLKIRAFDPEWSDSTYNIVRILVIAFVVIVCYPFIPGSESAAFKGVTIFIGVLFSLGSSSFLANVIAGYTMTYRRAFHVGDRIQVGDLMGDVTQVGLMVTHLRSVKNEEFVVPNSLILTTNLVNYTSLARERGLILHTTVGIGYETPWRQVEAMLLMAAERTPSLLREPAPFILQKSLGDYAVNYELNVYCDTPSAMYQLYTELHRNILDVFNEYNIQIMTPSYIADPSSPKVVPKAQWFAKPAEPPTQRKTMLKLSDAEGNGPG